MRQIPASLDAEVVQQIDTLLDALERDEGVCVLWAIESGSRAWGFPSPDSDYDARFLYVRGVDDYLGLRPRRDVIETPLDQVFDVNGWDVRKALALMVKGNATVGEWLRSPIVYRGDEEFRDAMLELAAGVTDRDGLVRHYLHVGQHNLDLVRSTGKLKKFFYALRPALTLRWLREHPGASVPPMDVPTLLVEADVPEPVARAVEELVELKARTREMGDAAVDPALTRFVEAELAAAAVAAEPARSKAEHDRAWAAAEQAFVGLLAARPAGASAVG